MCDSFIDINYIQIKPTKVKNFNKNFKWFKMVVALIRG